MWANVQATDMILFHEFKHTENFNRLISDKVILYYRELFEQYDGGRFVWELIVFVFQ